MKALHSACFSPVLFVGVFSLVGMSLSALSAHGAIIIDNPGDGATHGVGASTSLSIPGFTVGTGSNRMLVVTAGGEVAGGDITSVMYGSQSMNRAVFARETGTNQQFAEIWWLANPDSGSNTITATIDVSSEAWAISAISLENVVQTGPVDFDSFASTVSEPGGSISLNVSGETPLVIEAFSTNSGVTSTPGSGQFPFYSELTGNGGGYSHFGATDFLFSGSPSTQIWTISPSQRIGYVGAVFVGIPVPEPSSLILGVCGLALLGLKRRRKRD